MVCDNPALLFTPPGCPLGDPPLGPFAWRFGDGSARQTPTEGKARASFSPYVVHAFDTPGTYRVSVSVAAGGSADVVTLPIRVYPALAARIARHGNEAAAVMVGGDGHNLFDRWLLPDGSAAYGPVVTLPPSGTVRLTMVDGTGTEATATLTFG